MKYFAFLTITTFLLIPGATHYESKLEGPGKCNNKKYQTKEPGTCLKPKAYRMLKAVDGIEKNPYNNDFARKLLNALEPPVYQTIDTIVPGQDYNVPIRIYYPRKNTRQEKSEIILFIHGGGFMFGSIEEYDMAVKKFARMTGKILVALDYRLAPEHPYPAGLNDAKTVLDWLVTHAKELGSSDDKIVVMGDSAGGNIAAVLSLMDRDLGEHRIKCQVLYYPPTTFVEKRFPSRVNFLEDEKRSYLLTKDFVYQSKESYLPEGISEKDPYISPLEADLGGSLPPTLIINAQVDPLRDDGKYFAEKLEVEGQDVEYLEYEGIIHGFFNFYMIFKEAKDSMRKVNAFIDSQ